MAQNHSVSKEFGTEAIYFAGHGAAIIVGLMLMFTGIAMGVTIVMLPIGVPVGLVGLAVFLWGLFGKVQN